MDSISNAIRAAIVERVPDAVVEVSGGSGGHFALDVVSTAFAGKNMVESQRLVLSAIAHLMRGDGAPVHAIDRLKTRTP